MKIIKIGKDSYRRLNWFEEHEFELYVSGVIGIATACFVLLMLML